MAASAVAKAMADKKRRIRLRQGYGGQAKDAKKRKEERRVVSFQCGGRYE